LEITICIENKFTVIIAISQAITSVIIKTPLARKYKGLRE